MRPPSTKELAATITLALPLTECSVKIRTGGPDDDPADLADPVRSRTWGGHVPLVHAFGEPVPDDHCESAAPVPEYVAEWRCP